MTPWKLLLVCTFIGAAAHGYAADQRTRIFQEHARVRSIRGIAKGETTWALQKAGRTEPFQPKYVWKGRTNSLADLHTNTHSIALLVLKDGKVVWEEYLHGSHEQTWFASYSVGKSITSTLVGIAIQDGFIKSVNDPLTNYIPGLAGTAYQDVTIRDALQMMTGVAFERPEYDFKDQTDPFSRAVKESLLEQRYRFVEAAAALPKDCPPGTKFIYSTMNSAILGWLLENATQRRVCDYARERLWQPAGMESDAAWMLDGPVSIGREMTGGDFLATLRDYARFGLLWQENGKANGRQILSPEWVAAATQPDRPGVQFGKLYEGSQLGYGYQWWLFENGAFVAEGVHGQFIYVEPKAKVVIVKLSQWPKPWDESLELESYAFFESVVQAFQ